VRRALHDGQGTQRLISVLGEAANSLQGGVELRKYDKKYAADTVEPSQPVCAKLAADGDTINHFDIVLADWCTQTDRLLEDSDHARREPDDAGPGTELSFWRERMAKLNSILEQLKSREARLVLQTCQAANSPAVSTWRGVEGRCVARRGAARAPRAACHSACGLSGRARRFVCVLR
jgi:hypothetical protein